MTTNEEKSFLSAFRTSAELNAINWICWIHMSEGKKHCPTCLKLHECWFHEDKVPKCPLHFLCHCVSEPMRYREVVDNAQSEAPYSKFDPYLFDPDHFYKHGKSSMLESWGYSVEDSNWLKIEIEKQALQKYISGDYQLGVLNQYGQRISIRVEIPNRTDGGFVSFLTGWMVHPNGQITLNTPYGGK